MASGALFGFIRFLLRLNIIGRLNLSIGCRTLRTRHLLIIGHQHRLIAAPCASIDHGERLRQAPSNMHGERGKGILGRWALLYRYTTVWLSRVAQVQKSGRSITVHMVAIPPSMKENVRRSTFSALTSLGIGNVMYRNHAISYPKLIYRDRYRVVSSIVSYRILQYTYRIVSYRSHTASYRI